MSVRCDVMHRPSTTNHGLAVPVRQMPRDPLRGRLANLPRLRGQHARRLSKPASGDPLQCDLSKSQQGPAPGHPFGYDTQGCDVYTRTVYGARASITVGVCATLGAALT